MHTVCTSLGLALPQPQAEQGWAFAPTFPSQLQFGLGRTREYCPRAVCADLTQEQENRISTTRTIPQAAVLRAPPELLGEQQGSVTPGQSLPSPQWHTAASPSAVHSSCTEADPSG